MEGADWLSVGDRVKHKTFGTGTVVQMKAEKGMHHVWVELDRGDVTALGISPTADFLRPRRWYDLTTRRRRSIRCDVCGGAPVVATALHSYPGATLDRTQVCSEHRDSL